MARFEVHWDEVVTYSVFVEAENENEARLRWSDPAYWDSEPEIAGSDYTGNVEIYED